MRQSAAEDREPTGSAPLVERHYGNLHCGNCYRSTALVRTARFYTCVRCGAPAFECPACARISAEQGLGPTLTCTPCSLREETHADAS
jgi:hypothetical protein